MDQNPVRSVLYQLFFIRPNNNLSNSTILLYNYVLRCSFITLKVIQFSLRNGQAFLSEDRRSVLQKYRRDLQQLVDTEGDILFDVLLEKGAISNNNKEVIEVIIILTFNHMLIINVH